MRAFVAQLSSDAVELMTTVAAWGAPADPIDLATMVHRPVAGLRDAVDEAIGAGAMAWRDGELALAHDLFGEVLLDDLPAPLRSALHRQVARTPQAGGAPASRAAEQLLRAGDTAERALVRDVAAASVRTAPGVAADLLEQVRLTAGPGEPGRIELDQAIALFLAGRGREAEDLVRTQLPRTPDPRVRAQMHALALRSLVNRANIGAALTEVENLLAAPALPTASVRALKEARAWVLVLAGRLDAAEAAVGDAESTRAETQVPQSPNCASPRAPAWRSSADGAFKHYEYCRPAENSRLSIGSAAKPPSRCGPRSSPCTRTDGNVRGRPEPRPE